MHTLIMRSTRSKAKVSDTCRALLLLAFLFLSFQGYMQSFQATGNEDPQQSFGEPGEDDPPGTPSRHQVLVTFGGAQSQLQMRFCPPGRMLMSTENGKEYSSGYAETYDPETGVPTSFEVYQDFANSYARIWIEEQNEARILVRLRAALVADTGFPPTIAHRFDFSDAPYNAGFGDWVEEWYYIYPDATRTRYAKIYTAHAENSKPFGLEDEDRIPPNYVHEFMEAIVWTWNDHIPTDDIDIEALTLVNLEGQTHTVDYHTYPPYPDGFGPGEYWNIMQINLKSEWKPFVIGRNTGVTIRPYDAETETNPFQSWVGDNGGYATALGHMVNATHYERTTNTLSQVYLEGLSNTQDPGAVLSRLARSWINPPKLTGVTDGFEVEGDGYSEIERAYQLNRFDGTSVEFTLEGTQTHPIVNPSFVLTNSRNLNITFITLNGDTLTEGEDYFQGLEGDSRVIFVYHESEVDTEVLISGSEDLANTTGSIGPSITIYPNPLSDEVLVIGATGEAIDQLRITDMSGRIWLTKELDVHEESMTINIGSLEPGLYYVNLLGQGTSVTRKLIKQ